MSISDNQRLSEALHLASLGYKVFPARIDENGDKPPCSGVMWTRAASSGEREVRAMWDRHPDGIPAIATGQSRVVAVDLDVKAGQDGPARWRELTGAASLEGPRYPTRSGGWHLLYGLGEHGWSIGISASAVAPGVDVRGVGGYVLCYRPFEVTVGPDDLPPVPAFVASRTRTAGKTSTIVDDARARAVDEFGEPAKRAREFTTPEAWAYVEREALAPLRAATEGGRNDQLNRSAMVAGHFVPAFWSVERVTETLAGIADELGLRPGETLATIRSGLAAGMAEPYARRTEPASDPAVPEPDAPDAVERLLAKMLDRDALDTIEEPEPLIGRLLHKDSESWVIGAPGGFKSFVALDWAAHVALGMSWRGLETRQGPVVYIAAEGQKGIPQRVRAWEATYGRRLDGVRFLPEPVQVKGPDTDRTGQVAPGWAVLVEACRRIAPVLVVLDTQARMTVGLEENSNTAMGVLVEAVRLLKRATGACVLVVHHTGRNGRDARGASALDGAQDAEIRVDRPGEAEDRARLLATISVDKNKDATEDQTYEIQLEVVDLGESKYGGRLTSLALKPADEFGSPGRRKKWRDFKDNLTSNQMEIMQVMRDHSDGIGATMPVLRQWIAERRKELFGRSATPISRGSTDSAVRSLVEKELLIRDGRERVVLAEIVYDSAPSEPGDIDATL